MVKIEDITDEMISEFWFTTQISSGPNVTGCVVYVYYDSLDDSVKCSFATKPNGIIIFTYNTFEHLMMSESDLKSLIKTSIINFLLPYHRSDRLDSLLH